MSSTTVLVRNLILGLARARSSMIFEARKVSLRCTSVTSLPKRLRKFASSMAESPPPITMIFFARKKKPSQVAQELTPWPISFCSFGKLQPARRSAGGDDQGAGLQRLAVLEFKPERALRQDPHA